MVKGRNIMKAKRYLVSILLIIVLNICACGRMGNVSFMNVGADKIADATLEEFIEAVEADDREAIKGMFAEDALTQIDDIDSEIDAFIQFYHGTAQNWDNTSISAEVSSSGKEEYYQRISCKYKIETTEESYQIRFTKNVSAPTQEQEGMYKVGIITQECFEEKHEEFGSIVPGLYIVE